MLRTLPLTALLALVPAGARAEPLPVRPETSRGPATAKVTLVEWTDYQCPFCKRVQATVRRLEEVYRDDLRRSVRHNPLAFHKDAKLAAEAAMAAAAQGRFWEYHDTLFANQRQLSRDDLERYAADLGLDVARFRADLDARVHRGAVEADQAAAGQYGLRGTPGFLVNGVKVMGAQPLERFQEVVDAERAEATTLLAQGTPPEGVYAARVAANAQAAGEPKERPDPKPAPKPGPKPGAAPQARPKRLRVPVGDCVSRGPADALVTIVSFQDFQCPFCSRGSDTVDQVLQEYPGRVRLVFKHHVLPFHKDAQLAAEAAEAAHAQGRFWEMRDLLFDNPRALTRDDLEGYAAQLGLDRARFAADLDGGVHKAHIAADEALAAQLGSRGTPVFFVNGWEIRGAQPIERFRERVDEALAEAEAAVQRGVPRSRVYDEVTKDAPTRAAPAQGKRPTPRPKLDPAATYRVPVDDAQPVSGSEDALVTVVAFTNLQCPFCKRARDTLAELQSRYGQDLRVVVKHNPLAFHTHARGAAMAALAAHDQGRFAAMHDKLFDNTPQLERTDLDRYAAEIGLDLGRYRAFMDAARGEPVIAAHQAEATRLGARGTPTFYVNGRRLDGAQPLDSFVTLVDEELAEARVLVARGVPRRAVYEEVVRDGATSPVHEPEAADAERREVAVDPGDPSRGASDARVTLVAFLDFECPFSRRSAPVLDRLVRVYPDDLRLVVKQHPLPFHHNAMGAAEAALAAHDQGRFWGMYALLFAHAERLEPRDLLDYAERAGLDVLRFSAEIESHELRRRVEADVAQAKALGARGTPAFFVNGRHVRGAQPFERFQAIIDEERGR